jgi:hypothetical protein
MPPASTSRFPVKQSFGCMPDQGAARPSGDLTPGYGAATAARTVVVALPRAGRLLAALLLLGTVLLVVTLVNQTVVAAAAPSSAPPAAAAAVADRQGQIGNLPRVRTPAEPDAGVVAWQRYARAWDESVRELFRAGRQPGPGGLAAAGLRRSIPPTRGDGSGSHVPGVPPTFAWSWQGSGPRLGAWHRGKGGSGIEKHGGCNAARRAAERQRPGPGAGGAVVAGSEDAGQASRWAAAEAGRRFDDLFNFVHDPATLTVAFARVAGNHGANTPGVDGLTAAQVEAAIGCPGSWRACAPSSNRGAFGRWRCASAASPSRVGQARSARSGLPRWLQTAPPAGAVGVGGVRWAESAIFWRQAASTSGPNGTHQRPAGVRRAASWPCWTQ